MILPAAVDAQDMSITDDKNASRINAEQIRNAYNVFTKSIIGGSIAAVLFVLLQWPVIDHRTLISWLIVIAIVYICRGVLVYLFLKKNPDDSECRRWEIYFIVSAFSAGIIWSLGVILLLPTNNFPYQATVAIVVIGLSAATTSTLSSSIKSFVAFVYPIMLTLIIMFLIEGTFITYVFSFGFIVMVIFLTTGIYSTYISNWQNIQLRLEAEENHEALSLAVIEANKANAAKSDFLAKMSHELRTPLHGILCYAQFGEATTDAVEAKRAKEYFTKIIRSGDRLLLILNDLLDYSKLEAGHMSIAPTIANPLTVIMDCVSEQQAVINDKQLTVDYDFSDVLPKISFDQSRIGQVIMNILGNAIRHSPVQGHIYITCQGAVSEDSNNDAIKISISDQGGGVPVNELDKIFTKFYQSSKQFIVGGTGLGLAICKEIVEAHNGKIWCKNNDEGAVFNILLPVDKSI
ncbi:MAG: HAMP domain-containing histidine kinase [Gammaproteobacteria bacterium]|nr:HAMP domain-containing histidine kinase [Gammaproteobacteria bacterium]